MSTPVLWTGAPRCPDLLTIVWRMAAARSTSSTKIHSRSSGPASAFDASPDATPGLCARIERVDQLALCSLYCCPSPCFSVSGKAEANKDRVNCLGCDAHKCQCAERERKQHFRPFEYWR